MILYLGFGSLWIAGGLMLWQRKTGLVAFALGLALAFGGIASLSRAERKRAETYARKLARLPARLPAPAELAAQRSERPQGLPARASMPRGHPSIKPRRPQPVVESNFY